MFTMDQPNDNDVITIRIRGTLTHEDYRRLAPALEQTLKRRRTLRFFIKLEDFSGIEPAALWEDVKFDYKHSSRYGKTAIVGHKKWEEWGTNISKLFFDTEMRFFYEDQSDEAWRWVNG